MMEVVMRVVGVRVVVAEGRVWMGWRVLLVEGRVGMKGVIRN